jgi:hypothetical protein
VTRLGNLLARLGGANLEILKRVPTSTGDFVQMAFILLSTAGVAALSMYYALTQAVFTRDHAVPTAAGIALAAGWGVVILNLDRYLTTSMTSVWRGAKILAMAGVRLALALVIGLVISTPLVLQIFASDIDRRLVEVARVEQGRLDAQTTQSKEHFEAAQSRLTEAEGRLGGEAGGILSSPELQAATQRVADLEAALTAQDASVAKATDVYSCDYYGTPSREQLRDTYGDSGECSGKPGPNDPAPRLKEELDAAVAERATLAGELDQARADVESAQTAATAEARTGRPELLAAVSKARADRDAALDAYNADLAENAAVVRNDVGLYAQIKALGTLGGGLQAVHLTVAALFVLIELLPVLVKTLKCWGPPNAYDTLVAHEENLVTSDLDRDAATHQAIAQDRAQMSRDIAASLYATERDIALEAHRQVKDAARQRLPDEAERWARDIVAGLPRR